MCHQSYERALEFAHVRANVRSDEQGNVCRKGDSFLLTLFLQDRHLGFKIRRLDVGNQSPLEAAAQAVFNFRQLFRRPVTGDHDLLHRLVQRVESMEEFFLGAFLLCQKLNVIDQQDVDVAEFVAEAGHLVITQRVDHFIGELLAGDVADGRLRLYALDLVANGLHQVGLPHADAAIQE